LAGWQVDPATTRWTGRALRSILSRAGGREGAALLHLPEHRFHQPAVLFLVKGDCKLAHGDKISAWAGEGNAANCPRWEGRAMGKPRPAPNAFTFCTPDCTLEFFPQKKGLRIVRKPLKYLVGAR